MAAASRLPVGSHSANASWQLVTVFVSCVSKLQRPARELRSPVMVMVGRSRNKSRDEIKLRGIKEPGTGRRKQILVNLVRVGG